MPNIRCCVNCAGNNKVLSRSASRLIKGVFACWLVCALQVQALPEGGEVVAGEASIQVEGAVMDVQQASQRAIINYQNFNIAAQETVNFHQPNANAVVLNRVVGSNLAEIYGHINANGQVYLINPNGVLMGQGATLDVGGLVVTTLDMAQEDFLAGRDAFAGSAQGRVENQGVIQADQRVVLLAPEVINGGDIRVPDGQVVLRSARQALLQTPGSSIPLLVDQADLTGQVVNQGRIEAATVALANGANTNASISNTGVVRAVRASGAGGVIELLAPGGDITNSGHLDASALEGSGGKVNLAAVHIDQTGAISASAAGDSGDGGAINLHASDALALHDASRINADAAVRGNGGEIAVVAEKNAWFTDTASMTARGGGLSGDGGFVEFSGHEFVSVAGRVDVNSVTGKAGLWYIDPTDINIANTDAAGTFSGGNPHVWNLTGTPATSSIHVSSLRNALTTGDVTISTASGAASAGNITFNGFLDVNGLGTVRTLTLTANGSISFQSGSIYDSDLNTLTDGVNIIGTAGTGLFIGDGVGVNGTLGKINLTTTTGDATITGLGSIANASDAIRVTASAGRILDGGDVYNDATAPLANGGVILSGRDGIVNIDLDVNYLDATSSNANIALSEAGLINVTRLAAATSASLSAGGQILSTNSTVFGGTDLSLTSSSYIAVPQSGLTVAGNLRLQGTDVVDESSSRTVSLGANHLNLITSAAGGNSIINTATNLLSTSNASANTLTFNDSNAVTTVSISPFTGTTIINSGAGFDLTVGSHIELDSETGTLTFNAGKDLLVNGTVTDTIGAISNNNNLNFNATNNVTFGASGSADAGAGSVVVAASNGNVALGSIAGASMTVSATGAITDANGATVNMVGTNGSLTVGTTIGTLADQLEGTLSNLSIATTAGSAYFTNSQALSLTSAAVHGDLNLALPTAGNLTLVQAAPTITGDARFVVSAGQIVVPDVGWATTGNLTFTATNLVDSNNDLTLAAAAASITLSDAAASRSWATSFSSLALSLTGAGDFALTDSNALTLTSATTGANASFTTTNADLTLSADPTITGNLSLITTGIGNVVLPVAGISETGNLTINTNDVLDSDRDVTLAATNADISLRNAASARNWTTSFTNLILSLTGSGDFALTDANALTLTSASSGGNASFTTTNADLTLSAGPAVTGNLSLIATGTGNVIIPVAGIAQPAGLTINANDFLDTDRDLTLTATNASITLRNAASNRTWASSFDNLILALTGAGDFTLTDSNALTLSSANSGGTVNLTTTNADLTLSANTTVTGTLNLTTTGTGNVVVPIAGLTQSAGLTINANDLTDTDRDVALSATNADISLRNTASARNWTTSFTNLILSLTGSGDFALTDANALTLTSASSGGNASFTTTNADLTLSAGPAVTGNLSLITTGTGNVIIPVAGIAQPAGLTINANDLLDADRDVTLSATDASVALRSAASSRNWVTSFDNLILSLTGAGDFVLIDSSALTLTSATAGANASFTTTNADLTLSADPTVAGNLSLITTGTGNVVLPAPGINETGNLTINANDVLDADRDVTLGAGNATITLRNAAAARNWTTSFTNLILSLTGGGDLALIDTNALTLTSASTPGNASFTTTNADLTLSGAPAVTGNLSLITTGAGNLIIPGGGITQPAALTINANDVSDGDLNVSLAATNANITLRDVAATHNWSTGFNNLSLALTGTGNFNLTDSDALTVTSASHGGNLAVITTNADLTLGANPSVSGILNLTTTGAGNVIVPAAGFTQLAGLTINANDLSDGDLNVTLAATNANITLRNAAAAHTWATTFNALDLALTGAGDFNLTDANALTLNSISTGGNASFTTTNANLTLSADPSVAGNLTLNATASGNIILPTTGISESGNLTISASDLLDTDHAITLAAANANVTLSNAASAMVWNTSFTNLILSLTGGGSFDLTDTNALTLTSASTSGNASFTSTNADLTLSSDPAVAGNLILNATGAGNVNIPVGGIVQPAGLSINANDLLDADRAITLAATSANINLRNAIAAHTWNTTFTDLILSLTGGGDFSLTDTNALTLTSASTSGNASFTTTNADLTLATDPAVSGNLSLITTGSGNVIIPNSGIVQPAGLTINANDLSDGDANISLSATNADITLRTAAAARTWTTDFNNLNLALTGAGSFTLNDANALTLGAITAGANANFSSTNADLTLSANTAVTGTLNLTTSGTGNVIVPGTGFTQSGALTIDAYDLLDTDRAITLAATSANINLRNATAAHTWNTTFTDLILSLTGGGDFSLTDTDALILSSASTSGNASFTTTNADLTLAADPAVSGNLSLIATGPGNIIIPNSGIIQSAALTINANDLSDGDANISLSATNADITLRNAAAARTWTTDFNNLNLALTGAGSFTLNDANALTLGAITAGANANFSSTNADLTLSANTAVTGTLNLTTSGTGNVIVPATGFTQSGALTIDAYDLLDTDRTVTLAAASANINLRNAIAAHTWNTSFTDLILSLTGGGDFSLTDTNALTLTSANTSGNASFTATNADLTLAADPDVSGNLSLIATGSGNIIIPNSGIVQPAALTINANDLSDGDANISLSATNADITLRNAAAARTWAADFNNLNLALTGAGSFALNDANALTLGAITAGANANFSSTNADLTLSANTAVTGTLNLTTSGTGNVIVPGTGFTQSGALTIDAYDLLDTDRAITLAATSANINLRNAIAAHTWNTTFTDLILSLTGGGDFSLTDTNALTLTSASTSGNASFTTTNADLTLAADPAVSGNLSLIATGSGNIIIPNSGIVQPAALTIIANDLLDADRDVTLNATNASITLRNATLARSWITNFSQLDLSLTGAGAFSLNNTNALTLNAVTTGGNASFTSGINADLTLTADTNVAGTLNVTAAGAGNVLLPNNFIQTGALTLNSNDLLNVASLAATNANITLRNTAVDHTWNTSFDNLTLAATGPGNFNLTDADGLTLSAVSTGGSAAFNSTGANLILSIAPAVAGNLTLATINSGDIILPSAPFVTAGNLTLTADTISDGDNDLNLSAASANITLRSAATRNWLTQFDDLTLSLPLANADNFNLTDANALMLNSVISGGDVSFTTGNNANLTLANNSAVAGRLSLNTTGSGAIILPAIGFSQSGALTLNAYDLMDTDRDVRLAATNANITLRSNANTRNWATQFDSLNLALMGSGDFTLTDSDALQINAASSAGNAHFTTQNADLALSASPTVAGDLQLITTGVGRLIIPDNGINHGGDLFIDAKDLQDSDRSVNVRANHAQLNLRDTTAALMLTTRINSLDLTSPSMNAISLANASDLTLGTFNSAGDSAITSVGSLDLSQAAFTLGGTLNLTASDNLLLAASGFQTAGPLNIKAANLSAQGGVPVHLSATTADIQLTGSDAVSLIGDLQQLALRTESVGAVTISNNQNLILSHLDAPNADALSIAVAGALRIPNSGLATAHSLAIDAFDLLDDDRNLSLSAPQLRVALSAASGNNLWNLNVDELDAAVSGHADLQLVDIQGLRLVDLNGDGTGLSLADGNLALLLQSGDLTINADVGATDSSVDGTATGHIDIEVAQGNLTTQGPVQITSMQQTAAAPGDFAIALRLTDTSASDRAITLNAGAKLTAIGGDILIDARPINTQPAAKRQYIQAAGAQVAAYTDKNDVTTGRATINNIPFIPSSEQKIGSGRWLAIVADAPAQAFGGLDEYMDESGGLPPLPQQQAYGPSVDKQFTLAFGTCDELDPKNRNRCRVNSALKAFLSHWLVGGEMAPKMELK